jgi:hypothetical protein
MGLGGNDDRSVNEEVHSHRASRRPAPNARLNISRNTPPLASIAHGDVDHETFQNVDAGLHDIF